jgi:hypothetical protein
MRRLLIAQIPALVLSLLLFQSAALAQETCAENFSFQTFFGEVTLGQHSYGPIMNYKADLRLTNAFPSSIRIGTYNILNLYDHSSAHEESSYFPVEKDTERRLGNARAIHEINPDFQVVVEVENMAALQKFNDTYLDHEYEPLLIEGNDVRIDVAILVKRDLPVNFEWRSFKDYKATDGHKVFSRDLPVGLAFARDSAGNSIAAPKFAILATHYKSQRTKPGEPDTAIKRQEQVVATLDIVNKLQLQYGKDFPIFLAGDFNNKVHLAPEFSALFKRGFQDTLDLLPTPPKDRATHYFFPKKGGAPEANQIDAILALAPGVRVLQGSVIADTNNLGQALAAPRTFDERESRPSDHRPIGVVLELPH